MLAIGAVGYLEDGAFVAKQRLLQCPVERPECGGVIFTAGDKLLTVWPEVDTRHPIVMPLQRGLHLALQIPNRGNLVIRRRGKQLTIGAKSDIADGSRVAANRRDRRAIGCAPNARGGIAAGGGDEGAVGAVERVE